MIKYDYVIVYQYTLTNNFTSPVDDDLYFLNNPGRLNLKSVFIAPTDEFENFNYTIHLRSPNTFQSLQNL